MATTFMMAMLIDLMKALGTKTGSVMGWFTSALSLGHALGGMTSAYIADIYGYPTAFFTIAALPLLTICFLIPLTVSHRSAPLPQPEAAKKDAQTRRFAMLAQLKRLGPTVLWAALLAFYLNFLTDVLSTLFPLFALGLGISLSSIGFLKGINSIFGTATRLFSGMIFVWMDYRKVNGVALVLIAVAVIAVPSAAKIPAFVVIFSLFGICRALLRVSSSAVVVDEMKESTNGSGLASGVYHAGLDLGVLTAPVASGFFAEAFGIPAAFRFLPILLLGIMGSLLVIPRRTRVAVPE
jgi:predicted MFS family arabinose efflux permease